MKEETLASGMRVWSAQPEGPGPFPTVVILHERYGPVRFTFNNVDRMAQEGFAAFAPDMFHRHTGDRKRVEAAEDRAELQDTRSLTDMDELVAHIRGVSYADADRLVIAGYCQTGRTPIVVASQRDYVTGAVVMHGGIYNWDFNPVEKGQEPIAGFIPQLSCPVFGGFGELDEIISLPNVWTLRRMLEESRKSYDIHVFQGAVHSWMNTTTPAALKRYNAEATEPAWQAMLNFCREITSGAWDREQLICRFDSTVEPGRDFLP